ncbi:MULTISPECIES: hypothetical protein [unclassified Halomonas]|uniref:hypothetical protein n=1 Tax=unclassified Halomonas TaxID=2609666 RepID=UPI001CF1EAF2|nr:MULTISPECIES: hypothetical protein [unclassified Halomonas]UZH09795.1 hypothetical protein OM794_21080 [Halomonas sp. BDJS001]
MILVAPEGAEVLLTLEIGKAINQAIDLCQAEIAQVFELNQPCFLGCQLSSV